MGKNNLLNSVRLSNYLLIGCCLLLSILIFTNRTRLEGFELARVNSTDTEYIANSYDPLYNSNLAMENIDILMNTGPEIPQTQVNNPNIGTRPPNPSTGISENTNFNYTYQGNRSALGNNNTATTQQDSHYAKKI